MRFPWLTDPKCFAARLCRAGAYLLCVVPTGATTSAAPIVWTGLTHQFSKAAGADPSLPENQDPITSRVALTRGASGGIYNVVSESLSDITMSPADTEWATDIHNSGQTISSTNWANLLFEKWAAAYGGQVGM